MACSKMFGLIRNIVIVRPCEGYFMECGSLTQFRWSEKYLQRLSESCRGGDHYFATFINLQARRKTKFHLMDGGSAMQPQGVNDKLFFYVITKNVCQQFTSLTGKNITVGSPFTIDARCQGGQFYFAKGQSFFVIKDNQYLETTDISEGAFGDNKPEWRSLPKNLQNASYFFATSDLHYIMKNDNNQLMLSTRRIIHRQASDNIENTAIDKSLSGFLLKTDTAVSKEFQSKLFVIAVIKLTQ